MYKSQNTKYNHWPVKTFIFIVCNLFFWNLLFAKPCSAQALGLSISPPINEIMIIPGKEVTQSFTITNNGEDGMASIYIIPFRSQGELGNVALDEKNIVSSTSPYASWFTLITPISTFGQKFYLSGGQSQTVTLKISPPENVAEKDYYFTILYELDNNVPGSISPTGPTNQARIGSNLIISLSKDGAPKKDLNIVEFSAPKIIDSLGKLTFNIRIGNYSSYVFKPQGGITIKSTFSSPETLAIAPLNVISDSIRNIPCIENEETLTCQSKRKVLVGIYKSTLKITADDNGESKEKTVTTVAFPFSIILVIIFIFTTYKMIKTNVSITNKAKNKEKNPLDNSIGRPNNKS